MPSILLVDDNHSFVWAMRRVLERSGFDIHTAGNGFEAIRCVETTPVDVVVTDLNLPGVGGMGVIHELRRQACPSRIVAISGEIPTHPDFCLRSAGLQGADRVLQKPFSPDTLVTVVSELLGQPPTVGAPATAPAPV